MLNLCLTWFPVMYILIFTNSLYVKMHVAVCEIRFYKLCDDYLLNFNSHSHLMS